MYIFIILFACFSTEYKYGFHAPKNKIGTDDESYVEPYDIIGKEEIDQSLIPDDIREVIGPDDVNIFIDSVLQRNQWGDGIGRCHIQVGFSRWYLEPTEIDPEDPDAPPPLEPLPLPEAPGECIFESRIELPPIDDPNHTPIVDNWFVSGPLVGPDSIYLHGDQTIELELVTSEDGKMRYEWIDCNEAEFPFGQVFDLEIPEDENSYASIIEHGELEPVWLDNAVVVGANIGIDFPHDIDHRHFYNGFSDEDFRVKWSNTGMFPHENSVFTDLSDEEIEKLHPVFEIKFTNNKKNEWFAGEKLHCLPLQIYDDTISSENISQFQLNEFVGEDTFSLALDVHSNYLGPKIEHPYGEAVHSRSHISEGGLMLIVRALEELTDDEITDEESINE